MKKNIKKCLENGMKMKGSGCTDQQNRTAKIEEDFRDPGSKGSDTWTVSHLESLTADRLYRLQA